MNRLVKTAAAVTAFGLAAALAVPAQADTARYERQGRGTTAGIPISGLLGGVVGGRLLNGMLQGAAQPKPDARPVNRRPGAEPANHPAAVPANRQDGAHANRQNGAQANRQNGAQANRQNVVPANRRKRVITPNAAEDVTRQSGPLPELSQIASGLPLGGGGLTEALPVPVLPDAVRLTQPPAPSVKAGKNGGGQAVTSGGAYDALTGLLRTPTGDVVNQVNSAALLPATGSSVADVNRTAARAMNSTTKGADSLSADGVVTGLSQAARRALPHARSGRLSPVIGQVAPSEMAPVIEALPGATHAASADGLTPLAEDASSFVSTNATKAAGTYSDVLTALGWTTDALTSSVRDSWIRN
ncbi:hypothetical protein [Nonomuraea sp. NPDC049695]|uniref:hypothetical protein n=1 Tax=Nonomuraea sp. NPDC049695 TaxID=3154734 RepID=UPI00341691A5